MHFEDLKACRYGEGPFDPKNWCVPLLAIGWLEYPRPFIQGDAPQGLPLRVRTLNSQAAEEFFLFTFLGLHDCSICAANGLGSVTLPDSYSNLFIPGSNVVFVAPGRVDHYIDVHSYLPPKQFIDAVFNCPDPRSPEFREAIFVANASVEVPLWDAPRERSG